ncbi:Ribonuclease PH [Dissostichus eleginoides]|uniref:Ribonuclease PH n=1 Tax=Dissostichus eleginoides TaxID=100907 RepID=A0AAD9F8E8_DISEL|nr:Ribonuclease PH [Dissostichus eleginoides]
MAMWKTYGDYLEASGRTTALTEAGIASSGTADSFLKASHLTRTRHAHQVSALALAKLQQDAFLDMVTDNEKTKEAWRQDMITKSPTFHYWDTILKMEILGLIFVRAHREQDFPLYVESLKALVPWFFALDH